MNRVQGIDELHTELEANLDELVVFILLAAPILREHPPVVSKWERFQVPGISGFDEIFRSNVSITDIYSRGVSRQLFESYLLNAISLGEIFFLDICRMILLQKPIALLGANQANDQVVIPFKELVERDKETLIRERVDGRLGKLAMQAPKDQLNFFGRLTGMKADSLRCKHYCEINATRDIILHNRGVVDAKYLKKADALARGQTGETIPIDEPYFIESVRWIKRVCNSLRIRANKTISEIPPAVPTSPQSEPPVLPPRTVSRFLLRRLITPDEPSGAS